MNDLHLVSAVLKPKFPLGQLMMTTNAMHTLSATDVNTALARHAQCDWGDVCPEDSDANDTAIWGGSRMLSSYHTKNGVKFWIITEADRRATTVLLPEDY